MGDLRLEICWQVDDVDSPERTLLYADTASNAKTLGDKGDF